MQGMIHEAFYQNVAIKTDDAERKKKIHELVGLVERHEKRLKELLGEEGTAVLENYRECSQELGAIWEAAEFEKGFRLGGRIIMEIIFGKEDQVIQD